MNEDKELFFAKLILNTESMLIKEWLSLDATDVAAVDRTMQIFQTLTQDELQEAFEIFHEIQVFKLKYAPLADEEKEEILSEMEKSKDYRAQLSQNSYRQHNKTFWNIPEEELGLMDDNLTRGQCSRKRVYPGSASLTNVTIWRGNCRNYYSTTKCNNMSPTGGYYNCQSDCDKEYQFRSSSKYYTKFRFTSWAGADAVLMDAYVRQQYGGSAARRTYVYSGYRYTCILLGGTMATIFGGAWNVKANLSMH